MSHGDIWVLGEFSQSTFTDVTLELLGEARRLASSMNSKVVTLLLWKEMSLDISILSEYGTDIVFSVEHPLFESYLTERYMNVLTDLIFKEKPEILFMGATSMGRDLGPRLASHIKSGFISGCVDIKNASQKLEFIRNSYGGNVYSTWTCSEIRPVVVTVHSGTFGRRKLKKYNKADIVKPKIDIDNGSIQRQLIGFVTADPKTLDISEADIVITCGRGLGSKNNLSYIQELSELLGAVIGGTRPAVDNGWIPVGRQVGLTGKTITAKLLISLGISGASQHIMAINDCDTVIAVNTDPAAAIFKRADIAILANMHKLLPHLVSWLQNEYNA